MEAAEVSMVEVDLAGASTGVEAGPMEAERRCMAAGMRLMEEGASTADTAAVLTMATADITDTGGTEVTAGMATAGMAGIIGATLIMDGVGVLDGAGRMAGVGAIPMATRATRPIIIPIRTTVRRMTHTPIQTGIPTGIRIHTAARRDIGASRKGTGMRRKEIRQPIHRGILSRTQVRAGTRSRGALRRIRRRAMGLASRTCRTARFPRRRRRGG